MCRGCTHTPHIRKLKGFFVPSKLQWATLLLLVVTTSGGAVQAASSRRSRFRRTTNRSQTAQREQSLGLPRHEAFDAIGEGLKERKNEKEAQETARRFDDKVDFYYSYLDPVILED